MKKNNIYLNSEILIKVLQTLANEMCIPLLGCVKQQFSNDLKIAGGEPVFRWLFICWEVFKNTLKLWNVSRLWSSNEAGASHKQKFACTGIYVQKILEKIKKSSKVMKAGNYLFLNNLWALARNICLREGDWALDCVLSLLLEIFSIFPKF